MHSCILTKQNTSCKHNIFSSHANPGPVKNYFITLETFGVEITDSCSRHPVELIVYNGNSLIRCATLIPKKENIFNKINRMLLLLTPQHFYLLNFLSAYQLRGWILPIILSSHLSLRWFLSIYLSVLRSVWMFNFSLLFHSNQRGLSITISVRNAFFSLLSLFG